MNISKKANMLLFMACVYAEEHLLSLLDAVGDSDREFTATAEKELKEIRSYRLKRWGKSRLEKIIEDGVPTTIFNHP